MLCEQCYNGISFNFRLRLNEVPSREFQSIFPYLSVVAVKTLAFRSFFLAIAIHQKQRI